jgi:hypothetical protein
MSTTTAIFRLIGGAVLFVACVVTALLAPFTSMEKPSGEEGVGVSP